MAPSATRSPGKVLLIIRHAHRDKDRGREVDNGLSAKGRRQAAWGADYFRHHFSGRARFISSPKLRCLETLLPIARRARIEVSSLLDEGRGLRRRARAFLRQWRASRQGLTVISSHGDLIPALLEAASGAPVELAKGGWAILEEIDGRVRLTWILQSFEDLGPR